LESAKLTAPDACTNDRFGRSVGINGDYVAIGSVLDDDCGEQSGSVYIFHERTTGWQFDAKIIPSDGQADDFFGYALSFQNPYLLVGAHNDDDFGLNSGAAYLFKRSATDWLELEKFHAPLPSEEANYGESVDLNADYISIGAPYDVKNEQATGSAYISESPIITGIETSSSYNLEIYPNPTIDRIWVKLGNAGLIKAVALFNQSGEMLLRRKPTKNPFQLDLGFVNPGVYLLQVELSSGEVMTEKLVKEN
jgi:hypothetical protein